MRQVGILAAAGLYALEHHLDHLESDHQNAKRLARGLSQMDGIQIDPDEVATNIVLFDVASTGKDADTFVESMAHEEVLMIAFGPTTIRAVTHLDITTADIDKALEIIHKFIKKVKPV